MAGDLDSTTTTASLCHKRGNLDITTTTAVCTPGRGLANKFSGHGPGKPLNPPHQKQTQARLQQSQLHTRGSSSSSSSDSNTSGTAKAAANYALSTEAKASMGEKTDTEAKGGRLATSPRTIALTGATLTTTSRNGK